MVSELNFAISRVKMSAIIFSFCISFISILLMKPFAFRIGLVDEPNYRKNHNGSIPLIGGLSVFSGAAFSSVLFLDLNLQLQFFLFAAFALLVLGAFDDKYDLSVKSRIAVQVLLSFLMAYFTGLSISDLGNLGGAGDIKLGGFSIVFTCIAVIAAINAFNMIDGIDGLVGTLSFISFGFISWFLFSEQNSWYLLALLFMASLSAFLVFNLRWPFKGVNKIFMGDAGSMLIGFSVVWLLIVGTQVENKAFNPVTCLYFIAIPLMDMAAIMYRRIKKGKSPFKPDREHLHHIFERAGYSRKQSLFYIALVATCIASAGASMEALGAPEWFMLLVFLTIFVIYNNLLMHIWRIVAWIRKKKNAQII